MAEHVAELGLLEANDEMIWRAAEASGAVIVSKDEDFAVRAQTRSGGPRVVWVRTGNVRNADLIRRLEELWPAVLDALRRGEPLVEIA